MFKHFIKVIIIFVVSMVVFFLLEYESSLVKLNSLIQPFLFAATLSICITKPNFRKKLLLISLMFLMIMVFIYLFNNINLANWTGGLGFGMLVVIISTYIPELIKRGHIEKF